MRSEPSLTADLDSPAQGREILQLPAGFLLSGLDSWRSITCWFK